MASAAVAMAVAASLVAFAAQKTTPVHPGKGGSPHVKSEWTIDGANISIEYGRPSLKGRPLASVTKDPGPAWRTGADEATTLTTDKPLKFGTLSVPAGKYTLWTVAGDSWQLVVNKQTGQWGTQYSQKQDLGRVPMTTGKTSAPVEQLTISIDDTATGGTLRIEWGGVSATAPFTVG
jgi:hypothetical protein